MRQRNTLRKQVHAAPETSLSCVTNQVPTALKNPSNLRAISSGKGATTVGRVVETRRLCTCRRISYSDRCRCRKRAVHRFCVSTRKQPIFHAAKCRKRGGDKQGVKQGMSFSRKTPGIKAHDKVSERVSSMSSLLPMFFMKKCSAALQGYKDRKRSGCFQHESHVRRK